MRAVVQRARHARVEVGGEIVGAISRGLVAFVGAVLGDLLGWRLLRLMATLEVPTEALVKSSTLLVYEDPIYYVHGLVFALLTGVSASLLPAWRAARMPVTTARTVSCGAWSPA